jgi:hypothetical protein
MGPKALIFIHSLARKSLTKGQGSGITKIPSAMQAEAKASEIFTNLVEAGLKPEMMDDFIKSEADVAKYLNILDAYKRERMKPIPADSPRGKEITEALFGKRGEVVDMKGNVIPEGSGIMGGESIESLMKSGDVTKGTVTKKSKKVTDRDMFRAANENYITDTISDVNIIKNLNSMDPIEAMKEANKVIKREGPYKNLNQQQAKKILEDTEDHIFERDVTPMDEDFAAGGVAGLLGERTGYAQGTDVFRRQKKEIPEEIKKKIFEMIMGTRNLGKVIENSERTKSRIGSEGVKAYGLAEGGRTGYKEGLTAKQFKRQETENLAAKINEYFDIKGSGSISGKNQIMGAPDGITANTETFNAIINMDIPIIEKINLLGSLGYGKDRFKVEKGDEELFLGEGGYKDRNIGLGFNQGGEGLSGSVIRNLETGDNEYQVKFLKNLASGGRVGLKGGGMDMGAGSSKSSKSSGPAGGASSGGNYGGNNFKSDPDDNREQYGAQGQYSRPPSTPSDGGDNREQYGAQGQYQRPQLFNSQGLGVTPFNLSNKNFAKLVGPALIQYRILQKKKAMEQLGGDPFTPQDQNILDELNQMNEEEKIYSLPITAANGGRVGLRYGGDTMGGINDKSISSPGPDRSKVSEQQERNHQEAISRARDSQQYDYTAPKQIAKQIAINTGKNLAGQKIASVLGIGTGPIGILIALKGLYDQTKNPVYSEEDVTYGFPYQTGGRVGLKGGGRTITLMDGTKVYIPEGSTTSSGGLKDRIYSSSKGDLLREDIVRLMSFESGGRVGLRGGGADFIPTEKMNTDRMKVIREFLKRKIPHLDSGPIDKSILYDLQEALSSGSGLFPGYDVRNDLPREVEAKGGGRIGLAGGMTRRAFLKLMGGVAAGIGAIKSGIMGVGKKGVAKKVVKEVIKTPPVAGKPEWFDALINKVILEGDDVTKKLATKDREIVHTKKLNDQESVTVTQDLDDGAIRVEYDSPDNLGQEPVMMQFKPGMADETTGGKKPADRFDVVETEPRYVGPDNTDIEFIGESGGPNISFIESDVTNLKTFATGKGPTMKEIVKSKKRKDLTRAVNENDYEAAEYLGGKYGDGPEDYYSDDYRDYRYASGGLAYMLGE